MAWPSTPISTQHLDADSDSISSARADLKLTVDAVNDLINYGEPAGGSGGVTSIIAGTGISVNQSTGDVTITATGGGGGGGITRVAGSFATGTIITGTTNTKSNSVLIPANTFAAGDVIEIYTQWNITNTSGSYVANYGSVNFNSTDTLTGATQVDLWFADTSSPSQSNHLRLRMSLDVIDAASNTRGFYGSATQISSLDEGAGYGKNSTSPSPRTFNINWTQNQYLILAAYNSSANDGTIANVGYQIYKR